MRRVVWSLHPDDRERVDAALAGMARGFPVRDDQGRIQRVAVATADPAREELTPEPAVALSRYTP